MKTENVVLIGLGIIALGIGIYALLDRRKRVAEITALDWSPDAINWERLNGATINVGSWFWRISWVNKLDTEVYYMGSFTWNGESKEGETFAFALGVSALTLTGSGLPGTHTVTAKLKHLETSEVMDSTSATYTVV